MNIVEASKIRRGMRRPCFPPTLWYRWQGNQLVRSDGEIYQPDVADILADDWQVQPEEVVVSRYSFDEYLRKALYKYKLSILNSSPNNDIVVQNRIIEETAADFGFK